MVKVYRSRIPIVGAVIGAAAFLGIGIGGLTPQNNAGAGGIVVGSLSIAFSALLISSVATNRLVATHAGLVSWHTFRKVSIPWASISSFEVGSPRGLLPWPGLIISTATGQVRIDSVVGSKSFVEKIADELKNLQKDYFAQQS
jgi:hypothetical protein